MTDNLSDRGFSPEIQVITDPRFGRGQENFGGDPYLVSEMAVAAVHGLQPHGLHALHLEGGGLHLEEPALHEPQLHRQPGGRPPRSANARPHPHPHPNRNRNRNRNRDRDPNPN